MHSADAPGTGQGSSIAEFDGSNGITWQVVNDGVMGGLSEGELPSTQEGTLKFSGTLSLENNGGCSSFRSGDEALDLSNDLGLLLRVQGDASNAGHPLKPLSGRRGGERAATDEVAILWGVGGAERACPGDAPDDFPKVKRCLT